MNQIFLGAIFSSLSLHEAFVTATSSLYAICTYLNQAFISTEIVILTHLQTKRKKSMINEIALQVFNVNTFLGNKMATLT